MELSDITMILIDALTGDDNIPVIVSDLRAEIVEAQSRKVPLFGLDDLDKTDLFTLLTVLGREGLVERRPEGYVVSDAGRARARHLREHEATQVQGVEEAAQAALARVS